MARPRQPPLVTVLVATFNQAPYLRQALESLRAQTVSVDLFEVVVINDGSTDGTSQILEKYRHWARLVERANRGLVATCNEGLTMARGRYFARVDSDDLVAPDWLAALLEPLERDQAASCAYSDRREIRGGDTRYVSADAANLYTLEACGVLIRTALMTRLGGFRSFYWEEYDLYLRLRQMGRFLHVPRPLYVYRKHGAAMTGTLSNRLRGWIELADVWGAETLRTAGSHPELEQALRRAGPGTVCARGR